MNGMNVYAYMFNKPLSKDVCMNRPIIILLFLESNYV